MAVQVRNGAIYEVVSGERLALIGVSSWNNNGTLTIDSGGVVEASSLTTIQSLSVNNSGTYRHSSTTLRLGNGVTWVENGLMLAHSSGSVVSDLILDSSILEFRNQTPSSPAVYNSIIVNNGGVIRHGQNTTSPAMSLNLQVATLTVNAGGSLDLSGKGYYQSTSGFSWRV